MKYSGLPHGQEKSRKTKKNDKSQEKSGKKWGFLKKVRKLIFKYQILSI